MNFHLISCQDANDRLFPKWPMELLDGMSADARDRLLIQFSLERIDPEQVTIGRLLYFLQNLAAECEAFELRNAAE